MARILIPTHLQDVHAIGVAHVLRTKGHDAILWYGSDFPSREVASLDIPADESWSWEVKSGALGLLNENFDVIWYRRAASPVLPDDMHPGDRKVALAECRVFKKALWQLIAPKAFWVNPLSSRERATSKPVQLAEAISVGLKIPPTLCSNDPHRIRRFLEESSGEVVYKPFLPAQWEKEDEGLAVLFTSTVKPEDLPEDDILRLSPGIFQAPIEKVHELRVTYMGNHQIAAKLLSQERAISQLDWRAAFSEVKIEKAILPDDVDYSCRCLMERLGIVFGCFDFIVTPQDEYIFLEVNEMGQFLWVEEINPAIMLLEPFAEFLVSCDKNFKWRRTKGGVHWLDLREELIRRHMQEDFPLHVPNTNDFSVSDRSQQLALP